MSDVETPRRALLVPGSDILDPCLATRTPNSAHATPTTERNTEHGRPPRHRPPRRARFRRSGHRAARLLRRVRAYLMTANDKNIVKKGARQPPTKPPKASQGAATPSRPPGTGQSGGR